MTASYVGDLRRRLPLALCGTYAWLVSLAPVLNGARTFSIGLFALAALWAGFGLRNSSAFRVLSIFGFPLLSALTLFLAEEAELALEWFALLGWIGFAVASGVSELEFEAPSEDGGARAPLAARRTTSRALLLIPIWFGCAVLALWAFGSPLEGGHKGVLLLLVLFTAALLLFRTAGTWGMSFVTPGPEKNPWRARLVPGVLLLVAVVLLAVRRLASG